MADDHEPTDSTEPTEPPVPPLGEAVGGAQGDPTYLDADGSPSDPEGSDAPVEGRRNRTALIAVVALFVLILGAVGVVGARILLADGPKDVAYEVLTSISEQDPDFARQCELISPKLRADQFRLANVTTCDAWVKVQEANLKKSDGQAISSDKACKLTFKELRSDLETEFEITKVAEKGEVATVGYKRTSRYTGSDADAKACLKGGDRTQTGTGSLSLRRFDGDWRLDKLIG